MVMVAALNNTIYPCLIGSMESRSKQAVPVLSALKSRIRLKKTNCGGFQYVLILQTQRQIMKLPKSTNSQGHINFSHGLVQHALKIL